MADTLSAAEVEQRYVAAMGRDLGAVHVRLWNECAWLHLKWSEYVILFGTSPSRIDLLNRAAGPFIRIVQDSLFEDVLLHICRLTDPPRSAGRDNLTIERLPQLVAQSIRNAVEQRLDHVRGTSRFARDWRNRHIGHIDLALALRRQAKPLEPASRLGVSEALAAIAALLNEVESHYGTGPVAYDMIDHLGGAESLLYVLRDGLDARAEELRDLEAGRLRLEQIHRKPAV
jgi:AbiU2